MHKRYFVAGYRLFFALLATVALVAQLLHGLERPTFSLVNFFSFFTVQSNIIAVIVLFCASVGALKGIRSERFALLRGAATLYMATTGIIYTLLLSGLEESLQTAIPWINSVLHYIMPVVMVADWLIDRPVKQLAFKRALVWLVFPVAYAIYSLVRGHFVGWYPYPFLNPTEQGYGAVIVTSLVIAPALVLLVWFLTVVTRLNKTK